MQNLPLLTTFQVEKDCTRFRKINVTDPSEESIDEAMLSWPWEEG